MNRKLETARYVEFLVVERSSFLFNEETQKLYALNPHAAYIWTCLDDDLSLPDTAELVARDLEVSSSEAHAHVGQMVKQWTERRMLIGDDDPGASAPRPQRPTPTPDITGEPFERSDGLRFHATRVFQILSQRFEVRFASAEAEGSVMEILRHLYRTNTRAPTSTIDLIAEPKGTAIVVGSTCIAHCRSPDEVAPALKALMTTMTIEAEPYALAFHAAAVSTGQNTLLMPAVAGSGKSTLTAALLHAGFQYLSDDIVLLDQPSHRVRGFPLPICIKEAGTDALRSLYPELGSKPVHLRFDDARVRYLIPPPASWTPHAASETHEVKWIVFPHYDPDRETALEPIDSGEALTRLLPQTAAGVFLKKDDVSALADWIKELDCYELRIASLSSAIEALYSLDRFAPDANIQA